MTSLLFSKAELRKQRELIKLKQEESTLQKKIKELEKEVLSNMVEKGVNRVNRKDVSISLVERVYTVYHDVVKKQIKEVQSEAEEMNLIDFNKVTYLRMSSGEQKAS